MKHLIGIIAYKNSKSLEKCISILKDSSDIVLHIDAKTNIALFEKYKDDVFFIENRVSVSWGTISQVKAELSILNFFYERGYDYISIISEADLPMKKGEDINQFLNQKIGFEFIGFLDKVSYKTYDNVKYKYFEFLQGKNNSLRKFYKTLRLNRLFKNNYYSRLPKLYKGSNWFTLSRECVGYILEFLQNHPWYIAAFEYSFLPDEIFFHTIIGNSDFLSKVYRFEERNEYISSLRFIDWGNSGTSPNELKADSVLEYRSQSPEALFFRKITEKSNFSKYEEIIKSGK